eukprot:scaffold54373_cov24-Cyclotella_meneghiniana.AAC.1
MGVFDIAADMKRDLPVPTGHIQKAVMNCDVALMLSLLARVITDGAMNVVVASLGLSFSLGLLTNSPRWVSSFALPLTWGNRTSLLYLISLSTALTALVIFHDPVGVKSSCMSMVLFTPSEAYQSNANAILPELEWAKYPWSGSI